MKVIGKETANIGGTLKTEIILLLEQFTLIREISICKCVSLSMCTWMIKPQELLSMEKAET